jgi:hypothetical protein
MRRNPPQCGNLRFGPRHVNETPETPELDHGHRYFVAHVAQISRGNAQANADNSTDLVWSSLIRVCLAKTSYTYKMNDLAQTSIRTLPI